MELIVRTPFFGVGCTFLTRSSKYMLENDPSVAYLRTLCKAYGASVSGISNIPEKMLARTNDVDLHTATKRWKVSCGKTVGVTFADKEDALWVKCVEEKLSTATHTVEGRYRFENSPAKLSRPIKMSQPQPSIKGTHTAPSMPPRALPQKLLSRQTRSTTL